MQSSQPLHRKLVLAIIVTFNPDFVHFKDFLYKLNRQFLNILIIDNSSSTVNEIKNLAGKWSGQAKLHHIFNKTNIGLAAAQNLGVEFAKSEGFDAVCIFDQDSEILENYLETIISDFNSLTNAGEKVAAIGPCVVDKSTGHSYPVSIYRGVFLDRYYLKEKEIKACSYIISSGTLIPISITESVGPFLNELFINYIDIEWCFRASSKGFKVFTTNNTSLIQDIGLYRKNFLGRAIPVHNPKRRYYAARNSVIMLFLPHVSYSYKLREVVFNPMRLIFDCMIEGNSLHRIRFFLKGIYDGFRGV